MQLGLTTPHTKGTNVRDLQKLLLDRDWLKGPTDGEFGPDTAQAVYRAKYWLGYRKPDHKAGDLLFKYLRELKKPTPAMRIRSARRKKVAQQTPVRVRMFKEALRHLGEKEYPPDTNRIFYTAWYDMIGPWCAMFASYCGTKANSKVFKKGHYYAYCPYIVNDARAGRNNLTITHDPKQGDLVLFDWEGNGIADHVGFFDKWHRREGGEFNTVEGNTAVGNDSNGGEVMRRQRNIRQVQAFVHVGK